MKGGMVMGVFLLALSATTHAQLAAPHPKPTVPILKIRQDFISSTAPAKLPANFYAQNLPFFCRQELKLQKAHVPLMFRVGTVEECDRMEGKGRLR